MPWPVHPTGFFGARGDSDTYRIERSLRFNSADSAYLNRTFGAPTSQSVFTLSFWTKLGVLGTARQIFGVSTNHSFGFTSGDALNLTFAGSSALTTAALYRDPSAWYHIVWTQNSNAHTIYVNGVSAGTATATSNTFNTAVAHQFGAANTSNYFNGYITEAHFIDGQALTPSSFGETDAITGRWKSKAYGGTYGTNGFYLKFADNSGTTATTLGKDSSGNGNNWTPNNFSVTAGAGNDSLVDSPTNYGTDTGLGGEVRGNYCTLNTIDKSSNITLANGNLDYSQGATSGICKSTIGMSYGKWYWEVLITATNPAIGITNASASLSASYVGSDANGWCYYPADGQKYTNGTGSAYGATATTNDVVGIAFNADAGSIVFYKNNVSQGTAFTGLTSGPYFPSISRGNGSPSASVNFGQRPFAYTAPSGFKALCTQNLPQPTIQKPSTAMDVVTYTGTGASQSISSLGFSPDLVWIKGRSGATDHALYDTTRGATFDLVANSTAAQTTQAQGLTAFGSNGFTVGTLAKLNTNTSTYVAWAWDKTALDGFDIVSYAGNSSTQNISHGLGVSPSMIIVKTYSPSVDAGEGNWCVYHKSLGANKFAYLDLANAAVTSTTIWNNTSPTASVFSLGNDNNVNKTGKTQIAYCFAEIEGYSKFGSFAGNSSADGPFVWCGFRPAFVLFKANLNEAYWGIIDNKRNLHNLSDLSIFVGIPNSEFSTLAKIDILSNGFKVRSGGNDNINYSGYDTIFAAFAESPFKYARAR